MKILHIASIKNNELNGINIAVPCHIISENEYCEAYFYNINDEEISSLNRYQVYSLSNEFLEKIDFVIFHGVFEIEYIQIYRILKKSNIKYYVFPHGSLTKHALRKKVFKKIIALFICFNRFIYNSKGLILLSESEKNNLSKKFKKLNIILSSNGVYNSEVKKEQFSKDCVRYIYIGRLEYVIKGFDLLFDALVKVKEQGKVYNIKLDIFGPNLFHRKEKLINEINKRSLNDIVQLYDPVVGKEKEEQLLSHDIFIQTSRTEGLPMGIIEALNYGLPCICTKGTSLGETIRDNNLGWCAENNYNSVYDAILNSINSKDKWEEISKRAITYTTEKYEWSKISKLLIEDISKNSK